MKKVLALVVGLMFAFVTVAFAATFEKPDTVSGKTGKSFKEIHEEQEGKKATETAEKTAAEKKAEEKAAAEKRAAKKAKKAKKAEKEAA